MANPGTTVAGITLVALVGVGALAWKAADTAPKDRKADVTSSTAPVASPGSSQAPVQEPPPAAIPANSGSGKRVVYSVGQSRVWLIDTVNGKEEALRTYPVVAGSVLTPPDEYRVKGKTVGPQRGGDGLRIENTVAIGSFNGMTLGFSATDTPLDQVAAGSVPPSSPSATTTRRPTGRATATKSPTATARPKNAGVRETPADGKALFEFVDIGTLVVVVP
ncbi:hypothetical protein [Yinghuangia sp. YIM S09857]|uniref:hypothetical protein n=1 Tax=Yinghuangia sp. YIM S09857 TaxID=3436929 RepID=UPI003F5384A4